MVLRILDKYRLELHWNSVTYNREDVAIFEGAYFCGPVFKDAEKLRDEDELIVDMTDQHQILIPEYYQAVLRGKGVEYERDRVFLKEAFLRGKHVNAVETLGNNDWLLIDCTAHDVQNYQGKRGKKMASGGYLTNYTHPLVYGAEVRKATGEEKF